MAITRRETKVGARFDVEWRLPDRSKRRKSFKTERDARVFEARSLPNRYLATWSIPRQGVSRSRPSTNPGWHRG
jgi:hypothetical protein